MAFSNSSESITWGRLGISNTVFHSMNYRDYQIKIYEVNGNQNAELRKYCFAPNTMLDHKSAKASYNRIYKRHEMEFKVAMWNSELQSMVVNELKRVTGLPITSDQVNVIPFEEVTLASSEPYYGFKLPAQWTSYSQTPKSIKFTLICDSQSKAEELVEYMHHTPEHFGHFRLLLGLTSSVAQRQETTISVENIMAGGLMSTLLQNYPKEVLLTADDEKRLVKESFTQVVMQHFSDLPTVALQGEDRIYAVLRDLLISSREIIEQENDEKWQSVFWNEENYRPDKVTRELNEIYKNLDGETKSKFRDVINSSRAGGFNLEMAAEGNTLFRIVKGKMSGKMSGTVNWSDSSDHSKSNFVKLLNESKNHVEWNGEKFVPKQLALARINTFKLNDKKSFTNQQCFINYKTGFLSTNINVVPNETTSQGESNEEQTNSINLGEAPCIGIDLRTTQSFVAVFRNNTCEVIPDNNGNLTMPSCVAFTDTECLVGEDAERQAIDNPTNTAGNLASMQNVMQNRDEEMFETLGKILNASYEALRVFLAMIEEDTEQLIHNTALSIRNSNSNSTSNTIMHLIQTNLKS